MKLRIKTITPLHISTGKDLETLDYVYQDNFIYRLHLEKSLEILATEDPGVYSKFSDWVDAKIGSLLKTDDNKEQSETRKTTNLKEFCRVKYPQSGIFSKVLEGATLYKAFAPFGRGESSLLNEQIKDSANKPYIPGSSIKGAIKTALAANAWSKLSDGERKKVLGDEKTRVLKKNNRIEYSDEPLMNHLFTCRVVPDEQRWRNKKIFFDPARFSIMRFFHFSDAHIVEPFGENALEVLPVYLYLKGKEPQPQTNSQEVIPKGVVFEFDFRVDVEGLYTAFRESKHPKGMWRDLSTKIERLFDVKLDNVAKGDYEKLLTDGLFSVLGGVQAVEKFNQDRAWLREFLKISGGGGIAPDAAERLNAFIGDRVSEVGGTIKIGWGSGFTSTTIFNPLKTSDKEFVREMFKELGIGVRKSKGEKKNAPVDLDNFPKSKRMTAQSITSPEFFLSWVQIAPDLKPEPFVRKKIEMVTEKEPLTREEWIKELQKENESQKPKNNQAVRMNAVVLRSEPPFIFVQLLHSEFNAEYRVKYPAGLQADTLVTVQVTFQKGKIVNQPTLPKPLNQP